MTLSYILGLFTNYRHVQIWYKALGIQVVMYQVSRFLFVVRELSGKKVLVVGPVCNSHRNKWDNVSGKLNITYKCSPNLLKTVI